MRILLTRLSALGDIVHTWPLAEALVRLPERVELAWVVEEPFVPLVVGHPAVARVVAVASRRWQRQPLAAATRAEVGRARAALLEFAPEVAIDPQGLYKSAVWSWLSGAGTRVGFVHSMRREVLAGLGYTRTVMPPPGVRHVVDLNLSLLEVLGATPPYGAKPDATFLLPSEAACPVVLPGTVALLPASGGAGKAWPAASFSVLARRLADDGFPVLIVWGPGEREQAQSIAHAAGSGVALAPPTSLVELAALLSGCAAVTGGDTGPVHLAAALGVPTVAVFLTTDPERNAPRGRRVKVVSAAAVGARRGRARTAAMRQVGVAEVAEALAALLGEEAGRKGQP